MTLSTKRYKEVIAQNFDLLKAIKKLKDRIYELKDREHRLKKKIETLENNKDDNL